MHKVTKYKTKSYRNMGELDPQYILPTVSKKGLSPLGFIWIKNKNK